MKAVRRTLWGGLLLLCLILAGCGGPPSDIVQEAVEKDLNSRAGFKLGEIVNLEITNDYTQNQGDEKIYVYDYDAQVKHADDVRALLNKGEEGTYTGTVYLVKRGKGWYRVN